MKYCEYDSTYMTQNNQLVQAVQYDGTNKIIYKPKWLSVLFDTDDAYFESVEHNSNNYIITLFSNRKYKYDVYAGNWIVYFNNEIIMSFPDSVFKMLFKKYEPMFNVDDWVEHKNGGIYQIFHIAIIEKTNELVYVYKEYNSDKVWVRPIQEMEDGRFVLYSKEEK